MRDKIYVNWLLGKSISWILHRQADVGISPVQFSSSHHPLNAQAALASFVHHLAYKKTTRNKLARYRPKREELFSILFMLC